MLHLIKLFHICTMYHDPVLVTSLLNSHIKNNKWDIGNKHIYSWA